MKARVSLAFVLALCTAGAPRLSTAAPIPKDAAKGVLYHPTRVGAKWVYKSGDRDSVEVVTDVKEKDGAKLVAVGHEIGAKVTPFRVVSVSAHGLCLPAGEVGEFTLNEPLWLLKLPHAPGNKWEAVLDVAQFGRVVGSAKADGPERVEVPAGTYQAIRVVLELQIDGRTGKPVPQTIWYAPGIGKVKEVQGDRVEELKSFDPGKE